MQLKIKRLNPNAVIPSYAHSSDAALDLTAVSRHFDAQGNVVYGFGIAIEIPEGYVGLVYPRSSIANKDLALSNAVGVIDPGYRGEITAKFKPTLEYVDNALTESKGITGAPDSHGGSVQTDPNLQSVSFCGADGFYGDNINAPRMYRIVDSRTRRYILDPRIYDVGDRCAQLILHPIPRIEFIEVDELSPSDRGTGGYGSTGN